jgi:outer membrane receptor protein involved in Fe transport
VELGFRWRFLLGARFSLAASFAFTNYDDHDDFRYDAADDAMVPVQVKASSYGYGLEARYAPGSPDRSWQPFVALEAGLQRLRVEGWQKDFSAAIDQTVNTLGLAARLGARLDQFELSLVYRLNRFTTRQYFDTGVAQEYSWDTIVARAGWVIPF